MGLLTTLKKRGFTLVEMLTVISVSSVILVILAVVFRTGLWEVSKSSGRIEMVRNGRNALDNVQRYLSSVMAPASIIDSDGNTLNRTMAIFWPDEVHEPPTNIIDWQQRVQFFTPVDHLSGAPVPSARQLSETPTNFAFEIAPVPGANAELGQDLVLRRYNIPTPWPVGGVDDPPPLDPATSLDLTVQPRLIGRRLGIPDSSVPGGYRDAMQVRRLKEGALMIRINVSIQTISDETNRNRTMNATDMSTDNPTNTVTMQSIYQPPYFNIQ